MNTLHHLFQKVSSVMTEWYDTTKTHGITPVRNSHQNK